ncbi:MAG: TonB-dependent receptor [Acidobacteria bacterium]|nr:TonB-dependent receptor [Acidobacteriota bacterium]
MTSRSVVPFAAMLLLAAAASAQVASISGLVTDPSSAPVIGVKVTATNTATNVVTGTLTSQDGRYNLPQLPPGTYSLSLEAGGFAPARRTGIELTVGQIARIDVELQLGSVATSVNVEASALLLESESSTIGRLVDNRRVEELPLRGRNPYALVTIVPGARVPITWGDVPIDMFTDAHAVINGARGDQNEFLLDGIPNTNGVQGGANIFPAVDAVQEFKVETNNYSAEYGRAAGGIFNVVTKSGTNQLHGSAFNFHRDENVNANDFFQNRAGRPKPPYVFNQFGATVGGPIRKDRTFFFANYEGVREREGITFNGHVPTSEERAGNFSNARNAQGQIITIFDPLTTRGAGGAAVRDPFAGNLVPSTRFDRAAVEIQKYFPQPNAAGARFTNQDNFIAGTPNMINRDVWSIKADHSISSNHRISGMFAYDRSPSIRPNAFGNEATPTLGPQLFQRRGAAFEDTYTINPTTVLDFRYGLSRLMNRRVPFSYGIDIAKLGFPSALAAQTRIPCVPEAAITGFTQQFSRPNLTSSGAVGACDVIFFGLDTHSWKADLSKVRGRHSLKMGFDYRLMRNNTWQITERTFSFNNAFTQGPLATTPSSTAGYAYASFLLGYAAGGANNISPAIAAQYQFYSAFLQDNWRVTSKLTLNLGLRWEYSVPRTDRFDQLTNFDYAGQAPLRAPGLNPRGVLQYPGTNNLSRAQQNGDWNNFSPRFGFTFQVTQKTVLRGGFGASYAASQIGTGAGGLSGYSATTSMVTTLDGGLTPAQRLSDPFPAVIQPTGSSQGAATLLGQNVAFVNRTEPVPYTEQWNFNLQRELPMQMVFTASYVGSHGVKLQATRELNQLDPQSLALGDGLRQLVENPFFEQIRVGALASRTVTRAQLLRPYPHFTAVSATQSNWGNSVYHALQATLEKRLSKGLTFLASYSFSKLIDDVGGSFAGEATAATGVQNWQNLRNERSISPFDQTQSVVISHIWELPFGPKRGRGPQEGAAAKLAEGWQFQGITSFQDGPPLGISQGNNTTFAQGGILRPNRSDRDPRIPDPTVDRWFDTSVFSTPRPYAFGDSPRIISGLRGHGTRNFDMALAKKTQIYERSSLEFRAELFDIFNHPRFQVPVTDSSSNAFGRTSVQINKPRTIQFSLKFVF